ncbi:hypothetical protein J0B03_05805 [Alkalibacter rhizosphaerae]|uniref:Uncharacterized protein n=1 Tax=Alkalibacter rhizosphaerae TaxID=2815577 RepID=A0A974XGS0_9FIRM|nr:hypothetical protein [Alkalibacter rhizosphaerae]QSX09572.1 hypothetical protein J0B03_05805 [Alkalibacter rhizosphaerae]
MANVKTITFFFDISNNWIGYFGGITGGLVTLLRVILTLRSNEKIAHINNRHRVIPSLKYSTNEDLKRQNYVGSYTFIVEEFIKYANKEDNGAIKDLSTSIFIKNIGPGNARKMHISIIAKGNYKIISVLE